MKIEVNLLILIEMIPFIRKLKQCYFPCVINDFETASINHDIKLLKYDMNS